MTDPKPAALGFRPEPPCPHASYCSSRLCFLMGHKPIVEPETEAPPAKPVEPKERSLFDAEE